MARGIRCQFKDPAVPGKPEIVVSFGPVNADDAIAVARWIRDYNPAHLFLPEVTAQKEADSLPLHPALVGGLVDAALQLLGGDAAAEHLRIDYRGSALIGDQLKLEAVVYRKANEDPSAEVQMRVFQGKRMLVATAEALISWPGRSGAGLSSQTGSSDGRQR